MEKEITYRKLVLMQIERVLRATIERHNAKVTFQTLYALLPKIIREGTKETYKEVIETEDYQKATELILKEVSTIVDRHFFYFLFKKNNFFH